ncbi:unnamed protein product [Clonostachys rosea f. rosea IK726]|uniref:Uncharacterized protein n=2 Tax=Bionectria ochroleuca TaxID=29856 RepID=A0A0B7KE95_BIOOC|nr:unnamed protein product [Clonostachys rosea f. rosea IK726]
MKPDIDPVPADSILSLLWGNHLDGHRLRTGKTLATLDKAAYLDYFQLQYGYFTRSHDSNYNDMQIIEYVVNGIKSGATKETIFSNLKSWAGSDKPCGEKTYEDIVHLTARVLVMCNIGTLDNQANPRQYFEWKPTDNLQGVIKGHFHAEPQLQERVRLPKTFDAWAIERIGGISIQFTDNLADHLLLVNDDTTLLVFHHVAFLELQTKEPLLPEALVDETFRTLALLFPESEFISARRATREKRDWFKKLCQRHLSGHRCQVDDQILRCGTLKADARQIERFQYWRDRLVVLKQSYDDATPATLTQWWFDRRNGPQWYTFWIAITVLIVSTVLGLIQCVQGALQVYKAYHPS